MFNRSGRVVFLLVAGLLHACGGNGEGNGDGGSTMDVRDSATADDGGAPDTTSRVDARSDATPPDVTSVRDDGPLDSAMPVDVVSPPDDVVAPPDDVIAPPDDVPPPPDDVPLPPDDVPPPPPDAPACVRDCTGRGCGDDGCGGSCGACVGTESCNANGRCAPAPATCNVQAEVIVYGASAWNVLADAFRDSYTPCGNYYISIAPSGTPGTNPRANEGPRMRARGARFHALAEFNWGQWAMVTGMTWYEKGVEFRRRMDSAGYDVTQGDSWALNEFPSTTRTDATTQQHIIDAVHGLYDGPAGSPAVKGAIFNYGISQATTNLGPFKTSLETWLTNATFWVQMDNYVRWFGDEVYPSMDSTCVPGSMPGARAGYLNDFVEHLGVLSVAGPTGANTAQSYLSRAFVPVMTAVWNSGGPYGNTSFPIGEMEDFVSEEVYAVKVWAGSHAYPDGRIGFAWDRQTGVTDTDLAPLAARLADAIHYAYNSGTPTASHACSPSGAFTFCQCSVAGATFNGAWSTFATW